MESRLVAKQLVALALCLSTSAENVAFCAPGSKGKEARKPADPPMGEWWVERIEQDGGVFHKKGPTEFEWTAKFTADKWTVSLGRTTIADQSAAYFQNGTVFEIDLSPGEPKTMRKGIWKLDGDVLLICYGASGADRPTDFTAPKDSGRRLWTLKRK